MARTGNPQPYRWAAEQAAERMSAAVGEERMAWAMIVEGYTKLSELSEQKISPFPKS